MKEGTIRIEKRRTELQYANSEKTCRAPYAFADSELRGDAQMQKIRTGLIPVLMACSMGCGTIFNDKFVMATPPAGATIDDRPGTQPVEQRVAHHIKYSDGRSCTLAPHVRMLYLLGDIASVIGLFLDTGSGNYLVLSGETCAGVAIEK